MLKYALEHDMIDLTYIQVQIDMDKRKEILNRHPFSIWINNQGIYCTYFPDEKRGRVLKKRKTLDALENLIVDFWNEKESNPTIFEVYSEWISGKLERNEIQKSTKNRYDRQYKESMKIWGKKKIKNIQEIDIEDFLLSAIHEHNLTQKGFSNLRTIIYGIFKRAKKKKLVSFSITQVVSDMDISKKIFRREIRNDNELVFSKEEMPRIIHYFDSKEETKHLDLIDLGLYILFKSGLRPGELAGLYRSDIEKNIIHVHRTEIRYEDEDGAHYEVRDFPKTDAGIRDVIIPDDALWIIKKIFKINPFGTFLFEREGKRIRTYVFRSRLLSICKKIQITPKSPNKIRKTYGTILLDEHVDESIIISQMGHTDIKTTKSFYYKNRNNLAQKIEAINNVTSL